MNSPAGHPDSLTIVAAARGALSPAATRQLTFHCVVCDECRAQLETVRKLRHAYGLTVSAASGPATLLPLAGSVQ